MTENKRFEVVLNEFDEVEYIMDKEMMEDRDFAEFIDFVEDVCNENEQLKQQLKEYKQPNCKKCIEYSQDGVGDYCMSEKGLLGDAWKMFPYEWDYGNAKNCKEYEE